MIQLHKEKVKLDFEGTIIDIETIGDFKKKYNDPFRDEGSKCKEAWQNGRIDEALAHNRSCLLKERDILLQRGSREPDELNDFFY